MRFAFLFVMLMSMSVLSQIAHAEKFIVSSKKSKIHLGDDLPHSSLPVFVAMPPSELTTKDDCKKIYQDWKVMMQLGKLDDAVPAVSYIFAFSCTPTNHDHVDLWISGYAWALTPQGGELLKSVYGATLFLDEGNFWLDQAVASSGGVGIHKWSGNAGWVSQLVGLLPVSFQQADSYLNSLQDRLNAADGPGRRKILFDLGAQLRPDWSADEINKELDADIGYADSISVDYYPIFATLYGSYAEFGSRWSNSYKCPAAGKCFQ